MRQTSPPNVTIELSNTRRMPGAWIEDPVRLVPVGALNGTGVELAHSAGGERDSIQVAVLPKPFTII